MRVTFVLATADLSGGNRVISIYADRLAKRGHEVTLAWRPRRPLTLREKFRSLRRTRTLPRYQPLGPSHLDALSNVRKIIIDRFRPIVASDLPEADVVIATWWETAEWVAALPASKGAKAYFIQHYEAFENQPANRVDATWRLPMHKIIIANWLMQMAKDRFGDASASLVSNAVDLQQFHAPPRARQPVPTVGLMYSAIPFKGCDVSLAAIEMARAQLPQLAIVAFGADEPAPHLQLPKGTDFTLRPAQNRIPELYARCDAWLVASRSEGFGLPILEAMACRTPVIATPTGAAPELLGGGGGAIVPMGDAAAMAEQIVRIVTQPEPQWQAMSQAAYATASGYTWDDATALFEAALKKTAIVSR